MGFLQDWYKDNVTVGEDGTYRGKGPAAAILKPFVDEEAIESGMQQADVTRTIVAAGEDPAQFNLGPGATRYTAQGAISTAQRQREKDDRKEGVEDQLTVLRQTQEPGLQESRLNNQRLLQQGNQQHQLALLTLADSQDARADQMELERMRDRKADQRYNEQMERLDRKDRKMAMQSIVAGLASLGAAFAL